jgi:hypothetical protein
VAFLPHIITIAAFLPQKSPPGMAVLLQQLRRRIGNGAPSFVVPLRRDATFVSQKNGQGTPFCRKKAVFCRKQTVNCIKHILKKYFKQIWFHFEKNVFLPR